MQWQLVDTHRITLMLSTVWMLYPCYAEVFTTLDNIIGIHDMVYPHIKSYIYIYTYGWWLCLFFTGPDFSKGEMFELGESYPRIIPRIIPPNHTPESYPRKISTMNVSFGVVWDCSGLSSLNGPHKQIDQCWPDPVILGYLHIPSRHEL